MDDRNRLTDQDRERMRKHVRETLALWRGNGPRDVAVDALALRRVAYHSVGCSAYDFRQSELDEISSMVAAEISNEATAERMTQRTGRPYRAVSNGVELVDQTDSRPDWR